jgi:hypothetical protein
MDCLKRGEKTKAAMKDGSSLKTENWSKLRGWILSVGTVYNSELNVWC